MVKEKVRAEFLPLENKLLYIEMVKKLYGYYMEHIEMLPEEYLRFMDVNQDSKEQVICDYIAGMTDNYAVKIFREIFIPESWKI